MQTVDVGAHPSVGIISKSDTHYVFICMGKPISDFGTISFDTIDSHLRRGEPLPAGQICPVTLEDVDNYESACERAVDELCSDSEDDSFRAENGSALESLTLLTALRTYGGELHPERSASDTHVMMPLFATSMVIQNVLEAERAERSASAKKIAALEAELAALRLTRKDEE